MVYMKKLTRVIKEFQASIGITAKFEHPDFLAVMDQLRHIAENSKIPFGMHIEKPSPKELQLKLTEGYRFLAYSVDSVFISKMATAPVISVFCFFFFNIFNILVDQIVSPEALSKFIK